MASRATARVAPYNDDAVVGARDRVFVGCDPCGRPASRSTEQAHPSFT